MSLDLMDDARLAGAVAAEAGRLLLQLQSTRLFEGKALGCAGDAVAQAFIDAALKDHRPEDAILSEEAAADERRVDAARVWVVDPLDGTREYSERRADWAVHVALVVENAAVLGAVALPAQDVTFVSHRPPAAAPTCLGAIRMLVSRTRPAPQALEVAKLLDAELLPMGSAGAKAMAVLQGEADVYFHAGGQYEWDSCAPVAVARAAGLHVSRADGSPLRYNQPTPYLPDLVICRPELATAVLAAIARTAEPAEAQLVGSNQTPWGG